MKEEGVSSTVDMLVFASIMTLTCFILFTAIPADPHMNDERYAELVAQNTLLAFHNLRAGDLGGLEYQLDWTSSVGSTSRKLDHKTLSGLLAEDALCNLRVELFGGTVLSSGGARDLDAKTEGLVRSALRKLVGPAFDFRFTARVWQANLGVVSTTFEMEIDCTEDGRGKKLCSESMVIELPASMGELVPSEILTRFSPQTPVLELTLELWSK
jgi:hypothetical protein